MTALDENQGQLEAMLLEIARRHGTPTYAFDVLSAGIGGLDSLAAERIEWPTWYTGAKPVPLVTSDR